MLKKIICKPAFFLLGILLSIITSYIGLSLLKVPLYLIPQQLLVAIVGIILLKLYFHKLYLKYTLYGIIITNLMATIFLIGVLIMLAS
jgi:hypothetical protein